MRKGDAFRPRHTKETKYSLTSRAPTQGTRGTCLTRVGICHILEPIRGFRPLRGPAQAASISIRVGKCHRTGQQPGRISSPFAAELRHKLSERLPLLALHGSEKVTFGDDTLGRNTSPFSPGSMGRKKSPLRVVPARIFRWVGKCHRSLRAGRSENVTFRRK